jgi:hypothetical protein
MARNYKPTLKPGGMEDSSFRGMAMKLSYILITTLVWSLTLAFHPMTYNIKRNSHPFFVIMFP